MYKLPYFELNKPRYLEIDIKYHNPNLIKINTECEKSDWIDLRASETVEIKKGEFKLISLGISVKLPKGYEMHIAPRSSTFKNFKIIQTNSVAVIDNSYCGDMDIIKYPALAMEDTIIKENDRICQFRLVENMPSIFLHEVDFLDNEERGGFGSTGII